MTQKTLQSIIVKPIGSFCNLQCEYCFYLDKHHLYPGPPSTHRMTDDTLEKLIKDMFTCSNAPTFVWQGGDPTVMGLAFFQRVIALQQLHAKGQSYFNALQTHRMLLDNDKMKQMVPEHFKEDIELFGYTFDSYSTEVV